jgi:hypothetical protein
MDANRRQKPVERSSIISRLKGSSRASTPMSKASSVFGSLRRSREVSVLQQGEETNGATTASVSQNIIRKHTEGTGKPGSKKSKANYKPSFIKKNRRRAAGGLTVFGGSNKEVQIQALDLSAIDYLKKEPHLTRIKERLKWAKAHPPEQPEPSLLPMNLLDRSKCWVERKNKRLIVKKDKLLQAEACSFQPKLNRPKSCVRLTEKPSTVQPRSRRTQSNSYLEQYILKQEASLSLMLGEDFSCPVVNQPYSKQLSIDYSWQSPHRRTKSDDISGISTKCSPTPDKSRGDIGKPWAAFAQKINKEYRPLSPTDRLYSFSSGFDIRKFIARSKSSRQDFSGIRLSQC